MRMNLKNVIFGGSVTGVSDRSGAYEGSIQAWLPIKDIVQGVVVTRDKRFVKILELLPVNFYTMSSMDKSAAIEDFAAYLKIAPANLQINVLTQPFDLNGYLKLLKGYLEQETNERCRAMLEESIEYVPQLVKREALTHRFFLSFSYDPSMKAADHTPEAIAAVLNEKAEVARRYLDRCGVAVLEPEYADNFILDLFYRIINKHTSQHIRLPDGVFDMLGMVHGIYDEDTLKALETEAAVPSGKKKRKLFSRNKTISPLSRLEAGATTIPDLIAPPDIDTHHADYNARTKGLRHDSLMAEKVSWLTGWYSLNKKNLTEEDRAYIDAALIECYNNFGITFDNASVFEKDGVTPKRMPVIKDWYDVLMSKPQTEHLATVLTRYVSGSAISMGGPCNIDPDNPYTVIDLSGLPDDLMLPWVYAATGFATDIILQNGDVGTALLSDELWKLVGAHSNPLAADYTVRMVKLIRSQGGIAGVTSQGMADMMALDGGKYGKSILDSCRIKMVMQMEEQEARLIQKVLNLTEEETKMITRFHRGEGLLCIGHNHVPIAVHVSPKEYDAITTSPTDLRARMNS